MMAHKPTYEELEQRVKELRFLGKQYQQVVQDQTEFIVRWLPNGIRTFVNDSYCKFYGMSRDELIGTSFFPLVDPADLKIVKERLSALTPSNPVSSSEHRVILADGTHGWNLWTDRAIFDETGTLIEYQSVGRDITEQKMTRLEKEKLEIQLRQSQKMESIGTLAGGIAHDFNNILSAIMGYTSLAMEDIDKPLALKEYLDEVFSATHRAKELVLQILAFSRKSDQELKPLNVQLIAREVLKLLRSTIPSTIEIHHRIDPECSTILGDTSQIHQVIMNLCTNAFQAMTENGGILSLSLTPWFSDRNEMSIEAPLKPGSYLKLEVSDTGPGIAKDIQQKIFEPYFTTKERGKGTGLGLAVVHGIITRLKGNINVRSERGKGTTFTVFLPTIGSENEVLNNETGQDIPNGREHILIVDDDPAIVKMNKIMLEKIGYRITALTSSLETMKHFEKHPDDFDLVITDMTMPKLTGAELAEKMLHIKPTLPIILCSGYSELINEKKASALGISGYIFKPFDKKEFIQKIRTVLDETHASGPAVQ